MAPRSSSLVTTRATRAESRGAKRSVLTNFGLSMDGGHGAMRLCPPYESRNDESQMAGIAPCHFHLVTALAQRGGAVPGGGGGSEACPPLSSGVMLRMVTRRLIALGPSIGSFRYCSP